MPDPQTLAPIPIGGAGRFLAYLLAQSPTIAAATKAGLRVRVTARRWIAKDQRWEDLGQVHDHNEHIRRFFGGLLAVPKLSLRISVGGVDVERANY